MLLLLQLSFFIVAVTPTVPSSQHVLDSTHLTQRLSEEVVPTRYMLTFRFKENFVETNNFTGSAVITITIRNLSTSDSSFRLHAKGLTIKTMELYYWGTGETVKVKFSNPDPKTDMIIVTPSKKLEEDEYLLKICYSGPIGNKMVGIYRSSYIDKSRQKRHVVATQFKDIHARRAFPCFDEPRFKANFELEISYPKGYRVWANYEGTVSDSDSHWAYYERNVCDSDQNPNLKIKKTYTYPYPMSTYLVAFIIAEFKKCRREEELQYNGIDVQFCSKNEDIDNSEWVALNGAPGVLRYMANFTGFPNFAPGAMKPVVLAAIPDHAHSANANWGLLTFRESVIFWVEGGSTNRDKQNLVRVVSHALSQQWFGAYVTFSWWSDLFLSEGFATYFEYHAADQILPDWQLPKQFVMEQVHSALEDDSFNNSIPLSYNTDNADYSSRTNDVSYNKGASILRMVQHFLGIDKFQAGIVDYIRHNGAGSVTPNSLWNALQPYISKLPKAQRPPQDLKKIMDSWITKPGYPLLKTSIEYSDVVITQEEFSLDGPRGDTKWYVPVTYSAKDEGNTPRKAWLTPVNKLVLPGLAETLVVLNNQRVGFYRVDYDSDLLYKIQVSLGEDVNSIDELNRAAIIDDQMNLARAGKKLYKDVFDFVCFLRYDESYFSWSAALHGFNYLLSHAVNKGIRKRIVSFIKQHHDALDKVVSFEVEKPEDQLYTLRQVLVLTWKCQVEDEDCVRNATDRFENYKQNPDEYPSKNLRYIVYCNGLRYSNNSDKDFKFLWNEYQETMIPTMKVLLLKTLGCVSDTSYSMHLLTMTLKKDLIRPENAKYVFASVYSNGPQGVTNTIKFVVENYEGIIEHFDVNTVGSLLSSLAERATTKAHVQTLTKFAENFMPDNSTVKKFAQKAALVAAQNLEEIKKIEENFRIYATHEKHTVERRGFLSLLALLAVHLMFELF